jgi:hypothetical protein
VVTGDVCADSGDRGGGLSTVQLIVDNDGESGGCGDCDYGDGG